MIGHALAALSAALAVIGWGAAFFCAFRLGATWGQDSRRNLIMVGVVAIASGLATQATLATVAWETGMWTVPTTYPVAALGYRVLWLAGLLTVAGAASYPHCGHRGWKVLAAGGAVAAAASLVF